MSDYFEYQKAWDAIPKDHDDHAMYFEQGFDAGVKMILVEKYITTHILRNWKRERIERFAKHLLGDTCQACKGDKTPEGGK